MIDGISTAGLGLPDYELACSQHTDYVEALEKSLGKTAEKEFLPLQPGDVPNTCADVSELFEKFNYRPSTNISEGIPKFVNWYVDYYKS